MARPLVIASKSDFVKVKKKTKDQKRSPILVLDSSEVGGMAKLPDSPPVGFVSSSQKSSLHEPGIASVTIRSRGHPSTRCLPWGAVNEHFSTLLYYVNSSAC